MARCLVVYSSVTGNTKSVAEALCAALPPGTALCRVQEAPNPEEYDFIALGFWVHRAAPDPLMQRYMQRVQGKRVGFFGTLAAYPDSEHAREVVRAARELLAGNTIEAEFLCQGKIPPERLAKRLRGDDASAKHPMTEERKKRLLEAAKHPDERDFAAVRHIFSTVDYSLP